MGVTAGRAAIDDRHGLAVLGGSEHEAIARKDRERAADDEQDVGFVEGRERGVHPPFGHVPAEEHHVGHQDSAARFALGHDEVSQVVVGQLGVTVWQNACIKHVVGGEASLELVAGDDGVAGETADPLERAVELEDSSVPGLMVEPIDVLGEQRRQLTASFPASEREVPRVRLKGPKARPAESRAGPVPLPHLCTLHEFAMLNGGALARRAVRAAVIGNARIGAQPGAGEHAHASAADEPRQLVHVGAQRIVRPRGRGTTGKHRPSRSARRSLRSYRSGRRRARRRTG